MDLPRICADLPGTGGRIKAAPEDFAVEEMPLYEPGGAGEHVYVRHRRSGATTQDLVHRLARAFGLRPFDVGFAGLKDKVAVAEQTFSLQLPRADVAEVAARVAGELPGEVVWARRHANKLRRGHLLGNRFRVLVRGVVPDALERARAILTALGQRGLPNAYGEQRLGARDRNVARGLERLRDERRDWLANLHRTAWQADRFNAWLAERLALGAFLRLEAGDVAKRMDNGALFDVVDAAAESERAARGEITPTGPLYGRDMRRAGGAPGAREEALLAASEVTWDELARSRLLGSRRGARAVVWDAGATQAEGGLRLEFALGKGSYATVLLREVVGDGASDGPLPEDPD